MDMPIPASASVIRSMLQHPHILSVYTQDMHYAVNADIADFNADASKMILELDYTGADFEQHLTGGILSLDLEMPASIENGERETYSLSDISAKLFKTDNMLYRLECQLPDSVFVADSRGGVRIPFVLGMQSRVRLEIFPHALSVTGKLRNISTGGCMVEIDLVESIALEVGQDIPDITLEFPNGKTFSAAANIRHVRAVGQNGYAAIGVQFVDLSQAQTESLFYYVNESEREAAHRVGMEGSMVYPSPLFILGSKEKQLQQREMQEREKRARQPPMERGVMEVANRLQIGLMHLKNRNIFPSGIFYDCADTLLYLVKQDRKAFLCALSSLRDEPDWVRHALQVAGKLADMMLLRDPHDPTLREALLGTILHTMGKPLLISPQLPSLKMNMTPVHKAILRQHVAEMRQKLASLGWVAGPVCADILENANERLDGRGYPDGKKGKQLSATLRLLSIIKVINKLTNSRNGNPPRSPFQAYRRIYEASAAYDKDILLEYVQIYGFYPIGSLVKYSSGFLGWVMDIDTKGKPSEVHLVKNLRFPETNISSVVSRSDLAQVGRPVEIVDPAEYGMKVIRL